MNTRHIIFTTALVSTTTILACDESSSEADIELTTEDVVPETYVDAPDSAENLPFATVEISEGHRLQFFVLPDGGVAVEESGRWVATSTGSSP